MSKTDKTRPWAVKVLDHPNLVAEHHDHRDGVCDLPPKPTIENLCFGWRDSHCTYGINYSDPVLAGRNFFCGCRLCTGHYYLKEERRKQRREGKRLARNWRSEW